MSKTVVGLFSSMSEAEQVNQTLVAKGYSGRVIANESGVGSTAADVNGEGVGQKVSNFFHSLSGGDQDVHQHYATGVNSGGALLGVSCDDTQATEVAALLKQNGAREIEGASFNQTSTSSLASDNTGETAIPIVEEQLLVGKREVERGGVRVYSHVVEKSATADVTLRDEKVLVERRPVNRIATAADFDMGQGSMIELRATGEEAVVGKTARVVEEVVLGKSSSLHTEVIHDTVRKTEVDVENVGAADTTSRRNR